MNIKLNHLTQEVVDLLYGRSHYEAGTVVESIVSTLKSLPKRLSKSYFEDIEIVPLGQDFIEKYKDKLSQNSFDDYYDNTSSEFLDEEWKRMNYFDIRTIFYTVSVFSNEPFLGETKFVLDKTSVAQIGKIIQKYIPKAHILKYLIKPEVVIENFGKINRLNTSYFIDGREGTLKILEEQKYSDKNVNFTILSIPVAYKIEYPSRYISMNRIFKDDVNLFFPEGITLDNEDIDKINEIIAKQIDCTIISTGIFDTNSKELLTTISANEKALKKYLKMKRKKN